MRAAVLVGVDRIDVREVACESPAPREILVRVTAVGLCGTDFHIVAGHANYNRDARGRPVPLADAPQILGHEIAGVVEAVGTDVRDLTTGDRVVVDQGRNCVSEARAPLCEYCAGGDSHQCEFYREQEPAVLALTEPLGCVVHSSDVLARAPARYARPRSIVILGAGPAGLLFVQYLRQVLGFDGVLLVSEPNARKRALAERFGAETIDAKTDVEVVEVVAEKTHGRRAELLIEATGSGPAFATIAGLIRKQATVLMYGHGHAGVDLSVLNALQFLEPTLLSPVGASGGHVADGRPSTYVRALRLIEQGQVDVAAMITHRYASLDAVARVFAGEHRAPDYVKGVVTL